MSPRYFNIAFREIAVRSLEGYQASLVRAQRRTVLAQSLLQHEKNDTGDTPRRNILPSCGPLENGRTIQR
jgi:hypothetical protein